MWVEIDVRHMKEAPSTLLRYISEMGQYASKGLLLKFKLELALVELILTPSSPLNMSCLSSTHFLTGDKHLGCYNFHASTILEYENYIHLHHS